MLLVMTIFFVNKAVIASTVPILIITLFLLFVKFNVDGVVYARQYIMTSSAIEMNIIIFPYPLSMYIYSTTRTVIRSWRS